MGVFVSPGAYVRELDWSLYAPRLSASIVGMVGTATRGPINQPLLITNAAQLYETFGLSSPNHLAIYAAAQYFRAGQQLWFNRVASSAAAAATAAIPDTAGTPATTLNISGKTKGTYGNDVKVVISAGTKTALIDGTSVTTKRLTVLYRGGVVEAFDNLVRANAVANETYLFSDLVSRASKYITITDNVASVLAPANGTYTLTGGNDGLTGLVDADYIGTIVGQNRTGLQVFADVDRIDINLLAVPGHTSDAVQVAAIGICEQRGDAFCIIDPPFGLAVSGTDSILDYHNGVNTFASRPSLNSSYAALYWPWMQVYDASVDQKIWIPPSGAALETYARTDYQGEMWFAPAGLNRGKIGNALQLEMSPTQGERETLYGNGNAVNPLVDFNKYGIVIWGQRTLQRAPTALDRVNVRRMMLYLRKVVATATALLVFEQNDRTLWRQFINLVTPTLESMKNRRGIREFRVVCDETTNTEDVLEQNTMKARIFIKPTKAAEVIEIDLVLTNQGAVINELPAQAA